jgi:hypothetical protein
MISEVLTTVNAKCISFWDMTLCSKDFINVSQESDNSIFSLRMEVIDFSETLIPTYLPGLPSNCLFITKRLN